MIAYLVQHAEALPREENPERPLSGKGQADIIKVAAFISEHQKISLNTIVHSEKTRAQQTAEILAEYLRPHKGVIYENGLDPLADPVPWVNRLNSSEEDIMVVGHLPHLSRLAALLLCQDETKNVVTFQMGGVVCLERGDEDSWSILWMVVPQIIG